MGRDPTVFHAYEGCWGSTQHRRCGFRQQVSLGVRQMERGSTQKGGMPSCVKESRAIRIISG